MKNRKQSAEEYKCKDCGAEMNEGEAKTFTCCDECWDKSYRSNANKGVHDPEICGCENHSDYCPYNPSSPEYEGKSNKGVPTEEEIKDLLHKSILEIIMENGFLIKQENWNVSQMETRATYDSFRIINLLSRLSTATPKEGKECEHPKEERIAYHDSSVLCDGCGCIIEQYGEKIDNPAPLLGY